MAPRRSARTSAASDDIAGVIAQQLAGAIPDIVAQVAAAIQQQQHPHHPPPPPENEEVHHHIVQGCSYKEFLACKPKEFDGKGGALALNHWFEKTEAVIDISNCSDQNKVRFASNSLTDKALTWWNSEIRNRGREAAMSMTWEDFRALLLEEFCPRNEMQKLESEFWNHSMVGANHAEYTDRFHELARLCPQMVTTESKRIERYVYGLHPEVRRTMTATEPATIQSAIHKAGAVTDDLIRSGVFSTDKRKEPSGSNQGNFKKTKFDNGKSESNSRGGYAGTLPWCQNCNRHHSKEAPCVCSRCNRRGHVARDCRVGAIAAVPINAVKPSCYECGATDHFIQNCPKKKVGNQRNQGDQARGRVYLLGANETQEDPNSESGTFL